MQQQVLDNSGSLSFLGLEKRCFRVDHSLDFPESETALETRSLHPGLQNFVIASGRAAQVGRPRPRTPLIPTRI